MIISEELAKGYLHRYGFRTPHGAAATTAEDVRSKAEKLGGTVVVKALIPTGGRGKAGGVRICQSVEEAVTFANSLLGKPLLGYPVEKVLVEEAFSIKNEIYAGVVVNTTTAQIDLLFCCSGGMEVENIAHQDAAAIQKLSIEPGDLLPVHRVRKWLGQDIAGINLDGLAFVLTSLYRTAADLDANLLEINPLAVTEQGEFVLLDCKLEIDDNGLSRHPELNALYESKLNELEMRARKLGLSYVPLEGNIGVLTSGAGLGMMTVDLLQGCGMSAANFLDTGGAISEGQVRGALELILAIPNINGVIINLYGGINRMLEAAKGIAGALDKNANHRPIAVKIIGNQQEEAWSLLETQPDVHIIRVVQSEAAVDKLSELIR